jgi:hypothetical protein
MLQLLHPALDVSGVLSILEESSKTQQTHYTCIGFGQHRTQEESLEISIKVERWQFILPR